MKSSFYKVITGIVAVLGFIGGIVLGNNVKIYDFNTPLMIGSWVGTALLCLIFYGIASVLEYLEEISVSKNNSLHASSSYNSNNNGSPLEHFLKDEKSNSKTPAENEWKCPNCHSMNLYNDNGECPNCHWTP